MSPILGIWASSQQPPLNASSFESIATVTVGSGGSNTITFNSIPNTYKHLQLRITGLAGSADAWMQINSSVNAAITHQLYGNSSSANVGAYASYGYLDAGGTSNTYPAVYIIDILDYTNTNKNRVVRDLWGYDYNGSGRVGLDSWLYTTTAAITSITISNRAWAQHSNFALYGIKG